MRDALARELYAQAKANDKIRLVVADISPAGQLLEFGKEYPDRFINVGVAEATMIGVSAGMALKGLKPFCYTIATFSLYRPFEQIRNDLCYQNLPVTVIGMGAGVAYASLGSTHHAQEDIAIAGAIPNMQVLSPCDPMEAVDCIKWCATENKGPVYLRIGKSGEKVLTIGSKTGWEFGKLRYLRKGKGTCILTHGAISGMAVDVADALRDRGRSVSVASVSTLKPIDRAGIILALKEYAHVIVIEEHAPQGGLASMVKQFAWDCNAMCRLDCFTLKDEFIPDYSPKLLEAHGLSVKRIMDIVG